MNVGDTGIFQTPYSEVAQFIGQAFTIERVITQAEAEYDFEVLPMYEITFANGARIPAWPEEVEILPGIEYLEIFQ